MKPFALLLSLLVWASIGATQAQTFILEVGSTITPYSGATQIGPTETLTGLFSWAQVGSGIDDIDAFQLTSLDFESTSFFLTLNQGNNDQDPDTFTTGGAFFAAEVLDGGSTQLTIGPNEGTYEGPASSPTALSFEDLTLYPYPGGSYVAHLTLEAVVIPEPSSWAPLLAMGLFLLIALRRLRSGGGIPRFW